MSRRFPLFSTIIVLAAVATMIALGLWQLERLNEKEALLARYARAEALSTDAAWPVAVEDYPRVLYRHARIDCAVVDRIDAAAGESATGQSGWAHLARCRMPDGRDAVVAIGWSNNPTSPEWAGGEVGGIIAPAGRGIRLVASPSQAGLAELARPDPKSTPNNHLSYAIQWFFFAAVALVIYVLALRKRAREG